MSEHEGVLMGVELGEASIAEQDALESLLSNYSFHDAAIGVVALVASIFYFGYEGRNDVNVLTLLAVAVVAGLNQEVSLAWRVQVRDDVTITETYSFTHYLVCMIRSGTIDGAGVPSESTLARQ